MGKYSYKIFDKPLNEEEKAEYKKTMIPYIIGAVLIFAASNVAGMIYDWASTIK